MQAANPTSLNNRLYNITFQNRLGSANMPQLAFVNSGPLAGTGTPNGAISTTTEGQGSTEETVTFQGTTGGTVTFSYNGHAATTAVPFVTGQLPTAIQVQNAINTISDFMLRPITSR